jgi:hypothetical protein
MAETGVSQQVSREPSPPAFGRIDTVEKPVRVRLFAPRGHQKAGLIRPCGVRHASSKRLNSASTSSLRASAAATMPKKAK